MVGFYDADRRLTVAVRSLDEKDWVFVPLPRHTGWDSHNSIEIAVDRDGFVHLTADMHTSPLVSFRSRHPLSEPFTTDSFEPLHHMTGDQERRVTYPRFLHDAAGDLVFMYRYGSSGNGDQILNRYDTTTRQWHRLRGRARPYRSAASNRRGPGCRSVGRTTRARRRPGESSCSAGRRSPPTAIGREPNHYHHRACSE